MIVSKGEAVVLAVFTLRPCACIKIFPLTIFQSCHVWFKRLWLKIQRCSCMAHVKQRGNRRIFAWDIFETVFYIQNNDCLATCNDLTWPYKCSVSKLVNYLLIQQQVCMQLKSICKGMYLRHDSAWFVPMSNADNVSCYIICWQTCSYYPSLISLFAHDFNTSRNFL